MVNKHFFAGIAGMAAAVLLSACHDDIGVKTGSGAGMIAPGVSLDSSVKGSRASRVTHEDITVKDLNVSLTATDGTYTESWKTISEFPFDTQFPIGEYRIEVGYGDVKTEGFECPAYYGSSLFTVYENETANATVTATVANTLVSVVYTDAFRSYMEDYGATIHKVGNNNYLYYTQTETRPGYLEPGELALNVSFTKPNGQSATLDVTKFQALAAHHYTVTVDLNDGGGSGSAMLEISFDDNLDEEMITIDLSDELLNAPAPKITTSGDFDNGSVISVVEGQLPTADLRLNVFARGGLSTLTFNASSATLQALGIPTETDLVGADDMLTARFKQAGIDVRGAEEGSEAAVIDLNQAVKKLAEDAVFTVSATDKLGKMTEEPVAFQVKIVPLELSVINPSTLEIGGGQLSFDFVSNCSSLEGTSFQMMGAGGNWQKLEVVSAEQKSEGVWRVTVTVPADNQDVTVRCTQIGKYSEAITVERVTPSYSLTVADNDVWATHATIGVTSASATIDAAKIASMATVFVSANGGEYTAVASQAEGTTLTISGLQPSTAYSVKVSLTGDALDSEARTASLTTEAALAVPNGDFETLGQTLKETKLLQGGQWSISAGINYDSYAAYTVSEPTGWASVNAKTTSGSTRNTWFVVPSTFNTGLYYLSTVPSIKVIGTGGGSSTPAAYSGFAAQSGSNAMVIRNVAWDPSGTRPDVWRKEFASTDEYYNHTVPTIANRSAGKLFLGSYSYSGGTETYNEGVAFASRPLALNGHYTYTTDPGDASERATVKVEVLNGSTVIGTGEQTLGAAGSYTAFSVPVTYVANAPKATQVRVMLSSTDKASESDIQLTVYNSRYESYMIGATLTVDNLTFSY